MNDKIAPTRSAPPTDVAEMRWKLLYGVSNGSAPKHIVATVCVLTCRGFSPLPNFLKSLRVEKICWTRRERNTGRAAAETMGNACSEAIGARHKEKSKEDAHGVLLPTAMMLLLFGGSMMHLFCWTDRSVLQAI